MTIDAGRIRQAEQLIRPYIRRTPAIQVDPGEFGLECARLWLKLELLQHTGSFKPRGAFTNLLMREAPPAGVAAASGGYNAELVITGDRYADALAASEHWIAESGALAVHAYDQPETLFGQGTVGLEFEGQASDLDTLLVAVGGGGLIGGIAAWYAGRVKIVGVEPQAAPTLWNALRAGRPVDSEAGGIAA